MSELGDIRCNILITNEILVSYYDNFWVLVHFAEKSFHRIFGRTPFDRKIMCTNHCLTEHRLSESSFHRKFILLAELSSSPPGRALQAKICKSLFIQKLAFAEKHFQSNDFLSKNNSVK
jgi:hypothetical protein